MRKKLTDNVACLMITNTKALHKRDALLYMDSANTNALVGLTKPGDWAVGVSDKLEPYLQLWFLRMVNTGSIGTDPKAWGNFYGYDLKKLHSMQCLTPTTDVAKALLDRGFYAPTVYSPLAVKEALIQRGKAQKL